MLECIETSVFGVHMQIIHESHGVNPFYGYIVFRCNICRLFTLKMSSDFIPAERTVSARL